MIEFKDFGFEDNERYLEYLKRCIQIPSNASPMMVLAAKKKYSVRRAYVDNLCWQKFSVGDVEFWAAPVGDWDEIDWKKIFKAHVPAGTVFNLVPEYLLKIWQREFGTAIEIEEDRDFWDYILYLDRMEKLQGKNFKPFRNAINAFEKNYKYTVEEITPKIFDELRAFQSESEENLQSRVDNIEFAQNDDSDFLFALEHWDELKNLFGFVVRVEGKIVAYCLDEQIDETHSIAPFAKADYNFVGANQFAYWYDAKIALERGTVLQRASVSARHAEKIRRDLHGRGGIPDNSNARKSRLENFLRTAQKRFDDKTFWQTQHGRGKYFKGRNFIGTRRRGKNYLRLGRAGIYFVVGLEDFGRGV